MPNYRDGDHWFYRDEDSPLGAPARNDQERRLTLDDLLTGALITTDIGLLERIDDGDDHGWEVCRWKRDPA